jgi:hypothetical protein
LQILDLQNMVAQQQKANEMLLAARGLADPPKAVTTSPTEAQTGAPTEGVDAESVIRDDSDPNHDSIE